MKLKNISNEEKSILLMSAWNTFRFEHTKLQNKYNNELDELFTKIIETTIEDLK